MSWSLGDAVEAVKRGVAKGEVVVLAADCSVDYEGRSRSRLGWGERVIILKPDGAVLVHRPRGYEPVNWQPPGTVITVSPSEEGFVIRAVRRKPREVLVIRVRRVLGVCSWRMTDAAVFEGEGSEADMREAVSYDPSLLEEGLRVLATEYPVAGGFVDVLAEDKEGRLVVVELKKGRATTEAVVQLKRYVEALSKGGREVRGVLAAPSITGRAAAALRSLGLEFKRLSPSVCLKVLERKRAAEKGFPGLSM